MNLKSIFAILTLFLSFESWAQDTIKGYVHFTTGQGELEPLPGAFVHWAHHSTGVYTNGDGAFSIPVNEHTNQLISIFALYENDTVEVSRPDSIYHMIMRSSSLQKITVFGKIKDYGLSGIEPRTTINLSEREFQKAACCNLSESFQNAPAIDVSFGDAVTGTRQIKMLGLDGYYTLISREYMPSVRTTNSYYGMNYIPASWVKSIQITKGAGSIVNGYESIAGQINIEMRKPFDGEKFLLDQFVSESGRSETDVMYQWNVGQHVASSLFGKLALFTTAQDRNQDGFVDNPFGRQISLMNRWQFYTNKNLEGQFNVSYNNDLKEGGQTGYVSERNAQAYGMNVKNEQLDVWTKVGIVFPDKPYQSLGSQFRFNATNLEGRYGREISPTNYKANSKMFYGNIMLETIIGNTFHKIKTGASILADEMHETYKSLAFNRTEIVPGAFLEYTYQPKEQLSFVLGTRVDYNSIYGLSVTPRYHGKWRFNSDKTSIRTSAGLGRRTSNILAQNQQIFVSSRQIHIVESNSKGAYGLNQELAFNTGISLEHEFRISYFPATLYLDYFYTQFINEVVFDREAAGQVFFYNMENGTRSSSFQAQVDLNPWRRTEIRLAYRMFDVSTLYFNDSLGIAQPIRLQKAFIAKNRAFINITQDTRKGWQFSTTVTWYGPQRIPGITAGTGPLETQNSPDFVLWNFQISKTFKFPFEFYMGAENILNYKQENPIQMASNPFDQNFDAGLVWGPVFGRMIYGGFRLRINYKEQDNKNK